MPNWSPPPGLHRTIVEFHQPEEDLDEEGMVSKGADCVDSVGSRRDDQSRSRLHGVSEQSYRSMEAIAWADGDG